MSRSCYSDDYGDEFPGQLELYRANVDRSVRGYFGVNLLQEIDARLSKAKLDRAVGVEMWGESQRGVFDKEVEFLEAVRVVIAGLPLVGERTAQGSDSLDSERRSREPSDLGDTRRPEQAKEKTDAV